MLCMLSISKPQYCIQDSVHAAPYAHGRPPTILSAPSPAKENVSKHHSPVPPQPLV